jgi:hypothetical protein
MEQIAVICELSPSEVFETCGNLKFSMGPVLEEPDLAWIRQYKYMRAQNATYDHAQTSQLHADPEDNFALLSV